MTSDPSIAIAGRTTGFGNLPGVRTLRSGRFRLLLGALLLVVGASMLTGLLIRQASVPNGQFGIDLNAYVTAAQRLSGGQSPYADLASGAPIAAQGAGQYLYPPLLAQLLSPLAALPWALVSSAWAITQGLAIAAAVLTGLKLGLSPIGRGLSAGGVLWAIVAAVWFLPGFDTIWKGNVSGFLALALVLVATPVAAAGAIAALSTLVKVAPATVLPLALSANRRRAAWTVGVAAALLAVSVALNAQAWIEYARVLPNLFSGDATQPNNLSPWALALNLGVPAPLPSILRLVSLAAAVGLAVAAVPVARRHDGLPLATLMATVAMLLAPAQLWYHYLVVLLPFAAMAWPASTPRGRATLALSGSAVTLGIAWLPLATAGAIALVLAIATGLRHSAEGRR